MLNVAAAVIKQENRILICQRARDDDFGLKWEFPGGKLEAGETPEQCIVREITEELGLDIRVIGILAVTRHNDGEQDVHFTFYEAEIVSGTIKLNVHETAVWAPLNTLDEYDFLKADRPVVNLLLERYI
jgi:ADP-ribose pyrophosphatase